MKKRRKHGFVLLKHGKPTPEDEAERLRLQAELLRLRPIRGMAEFSAAELAMLTAKVQGWMRQRASHEPA